METTRDERLVPSGPIRWGAWLLPIAGIIPVLLFTYFMTTPDAQTDPKGAAETATSFVDLAGGYLYMLALIGLLFGLMALYGWLAGGRSRTLTLTGLVLSVASVGFLLAGFGANVLAGAVASDVYLAGNTGASAVLVKLSGGSFGTAILVDFIAAIVIGLVGGIAYGVAIWRSGTLPKWSGVLYALGFVLLVADAPILTHVGGILLAISGIWIARTIGQGQATALTAPAAASTI